MVSIHGFDSFVSVHSRPNQSMYSQYNTTQYFTGKAEFAGGELF